MLVLIRCCTQTPSRVVRALLIASPHLQLLLLMMHSLSLQMRSSILAKCTFRIIGPVVDNSNLGLVEAVRDVTVSRNKVHTESVSPRCHEKHQRDHHRKRRRRVPRRDIRLALGVSRHEEQRRHDSAAAHAGHDEARAPLAVLAEAAHAQRDDGREDDGLEEEHDEEHAHARVAALGDGGDEEDAVLISLCPQLHTNKHDFDSKRQ